MKALKEDEDSLDDSQLDAAERSMGMSADAVERLPDGEAGRESIAGRPGLRGRARGRRGAAETARRRRFEAEVEAEVDAEARATEADDGRRQRRRRP